MKTTNELPMYKNGLIVGIIFQVWSKPDNNGISHLEKEIRLTFEELDLIKKSESINFINY